MSFVMGSNNWTNTKPTKSKAINHACKFLILAFIISHSPPLLYIHPLEPKACQCQSTGLEISLSLAGLLHTTLQSLLHELELLIFARRREHWATICFSLSLLLLAAESLQVDIFLRADNEKEAEKGCERMQMNGIHVLTELFLADTVAFSPLVLDWELQENWNLVGNDNICVKALRDLQTLSQNYCRFRIE